VDSRTLNTALAAPKNVENNHAESKRIDVKVTIERAETEVHHVESQNAGSAALAALKTAKNKPDVS
jgi:hypothetical protein